MPLSAKQRRKRTLLRYGLTKTATSKQIREAKRSQRLGLGLKLNRLTSAPTKKERRQLERFYFNNDPLREQPSHEDLAMLKEYGKHWGYRGLSWNFLRLQEVHKGKLKAIRKLKKPKLPK